MLGRFKDVGISDDAQSLCLLYDYDVIFPLYDVIFVPWAHLRRRDFWNPKKAKIN